MLADLESLEKRQQSLTKRVRGNDNEAKETLALVEKVLPLLQEGKPARTLLPKLDEEERKRFRLLALLTGKPVLYVANVEESAAATGNALSAKVAAHAASEGAGSVVISAAIEAEVAQLADPADKAEFLDSLGLVEPGLNRIIRAGYELLGLLTFFTVGPKEARAWTVRKGASAPEAAGAIHTDFQRGFIRAETIAFDDYVACNGEAGARDNGKLRQEGKEYIVRDGDIFHFRFNV
jgi:ribosome-binding ATPase